MAEASLNQLFSKLAQLLKIAPIQGTTKLIIINRASYADADNVKKIIKALGQFIYGAEKDEAELVKTLQNIKDEYEESIRQLEQYITQELDHLEGKIAEAEDEKRITEIKQSIHNKNTS